MSLFMKEKYDYAIFISFEVNSDCSCQQHGEPKNGNVRSVLLRNNYKNKIK